MSNTHTLTIESAETIKHCADGRINVVWGYKDFEALVSALYDADGKLLNHIGASSYPVPTGRMIPNPFINQIRNAFGDERAQKYIDSGRPEMIKEMAQVKAPKWIVPQVIEEYSDCDEKEVRREYDASFGHFKETDLYDELD